MSAASLPIDKIIDCVPGNEEFQWLRDEWTRLHPDSIPGEAQIVEFVRESFTGNDCLLLKSAAGVRRVGGRSALRQLNTALREFVQTDFSGSIVQRSMLSRVALLEALAAGVRHSLRSAIEVNVRHYTKNWQWETLPYTEKMQASSCEPWFVRQLNDEYRTILKDVAGSCGWMHPGILLAAETMAVVEGHPPRVDASVQTWVLLAGDTPKRHFGVLARLTMERLPDGSGLLIPSSASSGSLTMPGAGDRFSDGLQNAWAAVRQLYPEPLGLDWRWSLDLYNGTRHLDDPPVSMPLTGRSAEAAFACAMLALHPRHAGSYDGQDPLDPHVAITARFADPGNESTALTRVIDVDVKTLPKDLERRRVKTIIVAHDHNDDDLPDDLWITVAEQRDRPADLQHAWEQISKWPRITREVKAGIVRNAEAVLETLCGPETENPQRDGHRYVRSPLRQVFPHLRSSGLSVDQLRNEEPHHQLTPDELQAFANGTWQPWQGPDEPPEQSSAAEARPGAPRIWLHADSGMGKSVQMVVSELTIATTNDARIPLRIGKALQEELSLSQFGWTDTGILSQLYDRALAQHVPEQDLADGLEWFQRQVRWGDVVFLLDALDQTSGSLNGLGGFLNSDPDVQQCVAIVAGRDEAFSAHSEAFAGISREDWAWLQVRELETESQAAFLGDRLKDQLLTGAKEDWPALSSENRRELMWRDLLGTPLLLKLMKELAKTPGANGSQLDGITNRYSVYEAAIKNLVCRAESKLEGRHANDIERLMSSLDEVLGEIAWLTISRHNFTGCLTGDDYRRVVAKHGAQLQNLFQIDLVGSLFDRYGTNGLEWRHRSFCEYYAGRFLVSSRFDSVDLGNDEQIPCVAPDRRRAILDSIQDLNVTVGSDHSDPPRNLMQDWHWTLRFALCHAEAGAARTELVLDLIRQGNPWVVYEVIDRDGMQFNTEIDELTRWLVHRNHTGERSYRSANEADTPPESLIAWYAAGGNEIVEELLASRSRDAAYIDSLLDLKAAATRTTRWKSAAEDWIPCRDESRIELPNRYLRHPSNDILQAFAQSFVQLPKGDFDPSDYHDAEELANAGLKMAGTGSNRTAIPIPMHGIAMSSFFVTNELFALFSPRHQLWYDSYSEHPDQPAVWVSWFMARSFCEWLTRTLNDGHIYCLPTEWQWEWMVRWGGMHDLQYWWGDEQTTPDGGWVMWRHLYSWSRTYRCGESRGQLFDPTSVGSFTRHGSFVDDGNPGIIDPVGNVWCWSGNQRSASHVFRSLRGSSFGYDPAGARSSYRTNSIPELRSYNIGFRVARLS